MEKQLLVHALLLSAIIAVVCGQGQFHASDPVGNFQVAYTASGGHYLVEDRSADGTQLLGNFGYQSSGGEQVGVAYGTDGAGFVIRAPGAASAASPSHYSSSAPRGGGSRGGGGGVSYNAVSDHQDPYLRYQAVNYPSSNAASSSDITTYSSLPASDFTTTTTTFETQTASSPYQQQQQQLAHDAGQGYSSAASYTSLPSFSSSSSYQSPLSYSSQTNFWDSPTHSAASLYRTPFTYSFSSYNDPYAPRYTPPTPPPQPIVPQYTPAPTLTTFPTVAPQLPQQISYHQPASSLDQLVAKLQAEQRRHSQLTRSQPQHYTPSVASQTPGASFLRYSFGTQLPYYANLFRPIY